MVGGRAGRGSIGLSRMSKLVIEGAMGADGETLVADREEPLVGLSKTRGVGSLTAIGCDGGAEDRMVDRKSVV